MVRSPTLQEVLSLNVLLVITDIHVPSQMIRNYIIHTIKIIAFCNVPVSIHVCPLTWQGKCHKY